MRILHLPADVAGMPAGLAEGERRLGHDSRILTLTRPKFGFPTEYCLDLDQRSRVGRLFTYAATLTRICRSFDVYNFNFGSSLLHFPDRGLYYRDLPLYRSGAKRVFTWQGCDARQRDTTVARIAERQGESAVSSCIDPRCGGGRCGPRQDDIRRRSIAAAARHADHMFAVNPDLLMVLPPGASSFLPYAVADYHAITPKEGPFCPNDTVHIVHAPTDRICKGTDHILSAIATLREEMGDRLRFTLVSGVTYREARRIYATADIFIDQMLTGWYGGVSVEVMRMGIPVVAFINPEHLALTPPAFADELPVVATGPAGLTAKLRQLIADRDGLSELGARGMAFAERWHEPSRVASHLLATIDSRWGTRLW
ncbi:conserved hypothetical protein [Magnetospirillum sp. LM-5]|uniref:glycosyltransferase n=1 Tax=Magnetospirillum sp. LM-5 TaxID=2681466 RepID=UPI001383AFA8|nr:hypothetical protein [Magnetospirillum sp. LM-5]CAA7618757.1 conserved hypothetical protein [Magnetospirillum sp. LM-5]